MAVNKKWGWGGNTRKVTEPASRKEAQDLVNEWLKQGGKIVKVPEGSSGIPIEPYKPRKKKVETPDI